MRRFALVLSCLLLSACFTAGKRGGDGVMTVYDLGPAVVKESAGRLVPVAVEVRAPLWVDALSLNYRLAFDEPARLREYAHARWAGPPAQMIQARLVRDHGVVNVGQGRSNCVLRVELDEFSQIFSNASDSLGVLRGRMQWLDSSRQRLAERAINIEIAASSADSRGAVAALTTGVERLSADIGAWENELQASGKIAACLR